MGNIKVVCGIIWKDSKIFLAKRKPEKSLGGYWEFPGGKVEYNETDEMALVRELKEEFGMEIKVEEYFKTAIHNYDNFTIELISFNCQFHEATFVMTDHDMYEWVDIDQIEKWKLAPADIEIANQLKLRI